MSTSPGMRWSWQEFCGDKNFTIWDTSHQDLSQCFQILCLQIPILSLIAIISSYYAGKYGEWTVRTSREKNIIKTRMTVILFLAVVPAIRIITQIINDPRSLYVINYFFTIIESLAWFVHFSYVSALKNRLGSSLRGPVILGSLWTMFYVVCIIRARSFYLSYSTTPTYDTMVWLIFSFIMIGLQTVYGLTLIPSEDSPSRRVAIDIVDQDDIMYTSILSQYSRFREDFDPHYLGTAMEGSNYTSRLLFTWANRLMDKGVKSQLTSPDDVFDLPDSLTCNTLHNKLRRVLDAPNNEDANITLFRGLHKCFGNEFYGVGILKFVADLAGFVSPLMLHELIVFIEDQRMPVVYGYFFGASIFVASVIGSFCTMHFDFIIGKISLKLQGSLIARIYRKILCLSPSVFRDISVGEIVNHISTDMSRIANSCLSFHTVWSIPFQLGVTLYLLYLQVGIASVAGVAFSIVLIPINKVIATKIGSLSVSMMEEKDKRVQLMNEIIKGIRVIKLHVWEEYFIFKILGIRNKEMKYLKSRKYLDALCVYFWATTPVMISTMTFTVYVYLGGQLNAATVFTSLALLNMLIVPLNAFPWVLNGVVEAWVSVKRVNSYLQFDEVNMLEYYTPKSESEEMKSVVIKNGSFSWTLDRMNLSNINMAVEKGQLVGIIGPVGSGKSSLLGAVLGEIQGVNGFVSVDDMENGIGYVPQTPWIQQCSVRENILFGKPYDPAKYRNVIEACALADDIQSWPNEDFEVVGESGSTLSGGQKARIALARAVYQDKPIYVMDDVLSAVDSQVAVHIYNECVRKLLRGKTRILVTHCCKLLTSADWVIVIENGTITKQGPPSEILTLENVMLDEDFQAAEHSSKEKSADPVATTGYRDQKEDSSNEIEKETRCTGVVSLKVYVNYWKSVGHFLAFLIILSIVGMQISRNAVDWWLSIWVSANLDARANITDLYYLSRFESNLIGEHATDVRYFLYGYMIIGFLNSVIVIFRAFLFAYGGIRAATRVHQYLLCSITKAKVAFFDVSPLGRILNRFSSDTYTVDDSLPFDINILLAQFFALIGTLFMTIYGIPWLCLFVAPLIPMYHWLQNRYRLTSRELKRLASVTLSPLYSHVSETVSGLTTIRAFKETPRFIRENEDKVDAMQKCSFSSLAAKLWLSMRLQIISLILIGGVCMISVLERHFDVAHSGFVGLAISYALTLTVSLNGVVNIFTETEQLMVAMERIDEYITKPESEQDNCKTEVAVPFAWPSQGLVSFTNVHLKYREDVDFSLKNVTFEAHPGEKIGIVGRTGAGKSSIFVSLFRLAEITSGAVCIDSINVCNVPLKRLRSMVTIISQDPFIFAGSVRENVDPLNEHSDFDIWEALNKCKLVPFVIKLGGMSTLLKSGGINISAGERQLLCLVRAALRNNKIVCIDEATANIDEETDKQIQDIIRNTFKYSTVFVIAHRVQSVLDTDRVLVMGHGEILECGPPQELLKNTASHFYRFANQNYV